MGILNHKGRPFGLGVVTRAHQEEVLCVSGSRLGERVNKAAHRDREIRCFSRAFAQTLLRCDLVRRGSE
jgi:hypothetical protein